ncbi:aromatic ring-hydroxylating oxygenase subunit alpha [Paenibacillus glycinis]|uniref:Rieske 2Fe-2S domain-containing protein n=1 Tax=Paenibacillus glycinis TaxID=2697035 RepID=A0ABW9XKW6_9BACL|nr:aromatic ring-hydroxylating dioxygenase subunit alpha [Paenibacillus glycinis]NBD23240.1 Rieske 2Fe-2S domain-containing protein [Paenibacillus glycinis]
MIEDPVLAQEWLPVCLSAELKEQLLKVTVAGEYVVVFRSEGGVHALKDVCVHRGAPLSLGKRKGDCIVCPYHGWEYDRGGQCVKIPQLDPARVIPPKAHTQAFGCEERYGLVWVRLLRSDGRFPIYPEVESGALRLHATMGPYGVKAAAPRLIENFLDVSHLAFLHEGYLGAPEHPYISDHDVHWIDGRGVSDDILIMQPNGDGRGREVQYRYVYEILSPVCVKFTKTDTETGDVVSIQLCVQPNEERRSAAYFLVTSNFDVDTQAFVSYQELIFKQDVEVLENQKPEELPLDLQLEMHLRSDRISIAYRSYLKERGVRWGVIYG